MHRRRRAGVGAAALLVLSVAGTVAADNLACNGTGMDWYISMVGETPCTTYQKLRQICNSQYAVGIQNVNTPPDTCSDQLSSCCCNNVAFALSMFCLNCQQNIGTGTGFDAGVGAYQDYLGTCNSATGLPSDIQKAVCNQGIKIDNDLYTNGWSDGAWFYVLSRDIIIKDNIVAQNNSFTHCASTTLNATSSSSISASSTSSSSSNSPTALPDNNATTTKKKLSGGAAAGIAIGAVIVLCAAIGAWYFCFRRRRQPQRAGVLEEPLGGRNMRQRDSVGGGVLDHDERLVPTSYPYSDVANSPGTSDYFAGAGGASLSGSRSGSGPHSDPGASSPYDSNSVGTGPGFAGLGAGTAYNPYDSQSTNSQQQNPLSPRRGFHTAGQASAGSSSDLHSEDRPQAGPLPRKRRPAPSTVPSSSSDQEGGGSGRRLGSEEPFLEADELELSDRPVLSSARSGSERHLDAGPADVSLGRSPSGRLPPAYGEQL